MSQNVAVAKLRAMTVWELPRRFIEEFDAALRSRHQDYLVRKIAWPLQANAEGGLSERARRRAAALAVDAAVRTMPPQGGVCGVLTVTRKWTIQPAIRGRWQVRRPEPSSNVACGRIPRVSQLMALASQFD